MTTLLQLVAISAFATPQATSAEELLDAVRHMNDWMQSVEFEWEVRAGAAKVPLNGTGVKVHRAGQYRYRRADGSTWSDFNEYMGDGDQRKWTISYVAGVKRVMIEDLQGGSSQATTQRMRNRARFEDGANEPWTLFTLPYLKELSIKDTPVSFIGWENVRGKRCAHIFVDVIGIPDAGTHLWLDIERGGHVVRREYRSRGNVVYGVTKDVELEEVSGPGAQRVWFPTRSTSQTLQNGDVVYQSQMTITRETIRFNRELADGDFEVKPPTNVATTDVDKATVAPQGSTELPSTKTGVPTVVADTIRRAEHQKSEVEARSRSRSGSFWQPLVTWVISGIAVVLFAIALYQRRVRA